ncbi:MAG: membrane dipeptidase [Saprospiraceae bacterium]|nr:membrane dipeptidase [Saprospiraceae bacterium]
MINSQEDANFWREQGVAFITLIHLVDYKSGAAAIKPGFIPALLNFKGLLRPNKKRGLTEDGKQVIRWLANAGIMIDLTHMSAQTRTDALNFMEQEGIPPISTHDVFKPIQNHSRGIPEDEVLRFYELGGYIALPISGESLKAKNSREDYQAQMDSLAAIGCYCDGSIHSYQFSYLAVKRHIESNLARFYLDSLATVSFDSLSEDEKVRFSIGFQSDFNGWLNHHRTIYGDKGCYELEEGKAYDLVEIAGMPNPSYMEDHWDWLRKKGVDLEPILRSSERFLQLWQQFLDDRGKFSAVE